MFNQIYWCEYNVNVNNRMCGVMIAQVKGDESMVIWNVNIIPDTWSGARPGSVHGHGCEYSWSELQGSRG